MSTEIVIASLPLIGKLIDLGFSFIDPNGVKVTTIEDLEAYTAKLEAIPDKAVKGGAP
jgi:hypothetical protein